MICPFCAIECHPLGNGHERCRECFSIFQTNAKATQYEEEYFQSKYDRQYGNSYLDDKISIMKRCENRMMAIERKTRVKQGATLLEIGSAAGYFLEVARKHHLQIQGWEISHFMVEYANQQNLNSEQGDFFELFQEWSDKNRKTFDYVAAFYVIEHFQRQVQLWFALQKLVKRGGWLLLALPSSFGPLFYLQNEKWLQVQPEDHFVCYGPSSLKKIASRFGFATVYTEPEGLHPDRITRNKALHPYIQKVQKIMTFSDTFFAILQKT